MTERLGQLVRATLAEHDDPDIAERAGWLVAGARARAGRRRTNRLAAAGAALAVVVIATSATLAGRGGSRDRGGDHGSPAAQGGTGSAASTASALSPADRATADRLDRAFRALWPSRDPLRRVLAHHTATGAWALSYRNPSSPGLPATGPGVAIDRARVPVAAMDPCTQPVAGPIRPRLCELTSRPDGSHVLSYERSGMDGRKWTYETVVTHYRTDGTVVTVWMGMYTDDGSAAMPDWAFGPDLLTNVAISPTLHL